MLKRIALGTLVVLCALALITPAGAVTVNGVEYTLLAKSKILMENSADCDPLPANTLGCLIINGNVGVSDPNGMLHIGSHNIINGTATAHNIFFGSFSHVTTCRYNVTSGAPAADVCDNIVTPLPAGTLPIVAAWPPGPLGAVPVDPCVNTAANVTVPAGVTQGLAPGCYRDVRVNAGATLNLAAGNYTFRSLRLIAGSTLNGAGSAATSVNGRDLIVSEAGVKINSITLKSPGTVGFSVKEFIEIGNSNTLNDVVLYAPTSAIHLHTGLRATNLEAVANFITVQPIITDQTPQLDCGCFSKVTDGVNSVTIEEGVNLLDVEQFFVSTTCNVTPCTAPNCFAVTASGVTNTTATLDTSGAAAGSYKVVGQWSAGSFCNDTIITVP